MINESKAPEAPVVETPKAPEAESFIDNRRAEIENLVIAENSTVQEQPDDVTSTADEKNVVESTKQEAPKIEEVDPLDRIKKSVQKRIDKVVAQKKSVEEELAEARAELERLKAQRSPEPQAPTQVTDDKPPTPEQVEAYIAKMMEEGNHKEVAAATRYLVKLEKELALKEIEEQRNRAAKEEEEKKAKQLEDWTNLCRDYAAYDESGKVDVKSDLNLQNQNGLLYKTALSLFNDKELHADFYNDPNPIQGFRRAVADAYREIHQQGLLKQTPKGEVIPRNPRQVLADPSAEAVEEPTQNNFNSLSDAEKVREEIRARNKNRYKR